MGCRILRIRLIGNRNGNGRMVGRGQGTIKSLLQQERLLNFFWVCSGGEDLEGGYTAWFMTAITQTSIHKDHTSAQSNSAPH